MDDKNFRFFEERLKIHYLCVGKQCDDLKNYARQNAPEAFKKDSLKEVLPLTCYSNTFRRRSIDIAVKIISTGGQIVHTVSQKILDQLKSKELWEQEPVPAS